MDSNIKNMDDDDLQAEYRRLDEIHAQSVKQSVAPLGERSDDDPEYLRRYAYVRDEMERRGLLGS